MIEWLDNSISSRANKFSVIWSSSKRLRAFRIVHSILFFFSISKSKTIFQVLLYYLLFTDSPVCVESTVVIVGASLDESISVPCRVNADPPDVEFEWSFSSSGERFEVPHGHYTTVQDVSVVGTDGSKSASIFYDSEETHGESDGKYFRSYLFIYFFVHSSIWIFFSANAYNSTQTI